MNCGKRCQEEARGSSEHERCVDLPTSHTRDCDRTVINLSGDQRAIGSSQFSIHDKRQYGTKQ